MNIVTARHVVGAVNDFQPRDFRRRLRGAGLTATEYRVAVELCEYAGVGKPAVWPAIDTLAYDCGVSRSTVIRALRRLRAEGVISCVAQKGGRGRTSRWQLVVKGVTDDTVYD